MADLIFCDCMKIDCWDGNEVAGGKPYWAAQLAGKKPDLNPIQNIWILIKKKVAAGNSSNLEDLKRAILHV